MIHWESVLRKTYYRAFMLAVLQLKMDISAQSFDELHGDFALYQFHSLGLMNIFPLFDLT